MNGAFGRSLMSAPGYKSELTIYLLSNTYCALVILDPWYQWHASARIVIIVKTGFFATACSPVSAYLLLRYPIEYSRKIMDQ